MPVGWVKIGDFRQITSRLSYFRGIMLHWLPHVVKPVVNLYAIWLWVTDITIHAQAALLFLFPRLWERRAFPFFHCGNVAMFLSTKTFPSFRPGNVSMFSSLRTCCGPGGCVHQLLFSCFCLRERFRVLICQERVHVSVSEKCFCVLVLLCPENVVWRHGLQTHRTHDNSDTRHFGTSSKVS